MRVLYLDELFLFNAAVDFLLIVSTGKLCGLRTRWGRQLLAAILGGGYAVAARLWGSLLATPGIRLSFSAVMVCCGCGGRSGRRLFRCAAVFLLLSALLGGVTVAVNALGGGLITTPGVLPVTGKGLPILLFAVAGTLLCATELSGAGLHSREELVTVELSYQGRSASCVALLDSGNTLRDPLSGTPVLICEAEAISVLWDNELWAAIHNNPEATALLAALAGSSHERRFRLIPCSTAAGSGLLAAFRPDCCKLGGVEQEVLVALYSGKLGEGGRFQALVGPLLMGNTARAHVREGAASV